MRSRLSHAIFVVLALSSSAIAQITVDPAKPFNPTLQQLTTPNPETYGTASEAVIAVSDMEFTPWQSATTFAYGNGKYVTFAGGSLLAGIHLPAGASITRIELQACNLNITGLGQLELQVKSNSGSVTALATVFQNANTGCTLTAVTLTPAHTVNNALNSYDLWFANSVLDGSIRIQAARVYYKLQISPDPSTATFADVPVGHPFHRFVEALVAAGITGGCGGSNYCPDAPVTRGQIAVFLSAALGLHWAP